MKKIRFYISLEKEEKWLNEMASQGWQLERKHTKYKFCEISSTNTIIKIDYRQFKSKYDFQNYITLFNDSGWGHIAGTKTSGKQYFKKIEEKAGDDIFSDSSSKAERYKRISNMWLLLSACYIAIYMSANINITTVLNPKLWYSSPGIWEKVGTSFWVAFLCDTPFAMMRGFIWLGFPCLIIIYTIFAVKARIYYQKINLKTGI